ncbi:MAG: hypothetical protein GPJ22_17335 [Microcystis aeruginosa LL13-03]|nr:hypothetical protein [Microcystis aeruginosa LL13-03]NCR67158.1 hypothetical protein [Microcystis aeruginosa LL11-07]
MRIKMMNVFPVNPQLLELLKEIATTVEIQADFCISHPNYQPWQLPIEAREKFQNLPLELQKKYLSLQLQGFLYGVYYNGSLRKILSLDNSSNSSSLDLENDTVLGIDTSFMEELHNNNFGEGYFDDGWLVLRYEEDGMIVVSKGGLRLHVEPAKHFKTSQSIPNIGETVAIRMPKNLLQKGFYLAASNVEPNLKSKLVRVYFNITHEGAISCMASLTKQLNQLPVFFHFKVLYNPDDYHRYDAGVLYLEKENYAKIKPILSQIYQENKSYFKPEIPLFTKFLASGLGLGEEPEQKLSEQDSFGTNRCQIVANGLLEAHERGYSSVSERLEAIIEQFSTLRINLEHPYLNQGSEDIYDLF